MSLDISNSNIAIALNCLPSHAGCLSARQTSFILRERFCISDANLASQTRFEESPSSQYLIATAPTEPSNTLTLENALCMKFQLIIRVSSGMSISDIPMKECETSVKSCHMFGRMRTSRRVRMRQILANQTRRLRIFVRLFKRTRIKGRCRER
jgi:hypothetical protein